MSVVSVASEQAHGTCASCGSALVSDQRYCLECGAPASPVRLAFLDVLQDGQELAVRQRAGYEGTVISAAGVLPAADPYGRSGVNSWLRRNSGILSLLSVLALCLIAGLLIGHWATQSGVPSKQVIELKGLPASASLPASSTAPASSSTATKSSGAKAAGASKAEEEAEEKTEAKESAAEKAPPPPAKKVNLNKLSKSTGKKHQEEIEANGAAPIETGG